MKKLALNLDLLTVETFDPSPVQEGGGTVNGAQATVPFNSCVVACSGATCATCVANTCQAGCASQFVTCATCPGQRTCGQHTCITPHATCYYTCDDLTCAFTCGDATCVC